MAFNVRDMVAKMSERGGLVKSSKFNVNIVKAPVVLDEDLKFYCTSAVLPGITYQTDEIRTSGYGNIEKRPYATIFQDVTLEFQCDNDGRVFDFFHQWSQSVFNFNNKTPLGGQTARGLSKGTFAYPKDYFGTIVLTVFDETKKEEDSQDDGNMVLAYYLEEAYPISISDMQVSWDQSDQLLKLPVQFTFTYWDSVTLDAGTVSNLSESRSNTTRNTQSRIDGNLRSIRERIGISSPTQIDRPSESQMQMREPSYYK